MAQKRKDISSLKRQMKSSEMEKFLFIIASCPLFDTDFRYQMTKANFPNRFSQYDLDEV